VVVGNEYLAAYARGFNDRVTVIPTTIDLDEYLPHETYVDRSPVAIGWSGSRTTLAHLRTLDRVLRQVAAQVPVRLHVIGTDVYPIEGVEAHVAEWRPDTEIPELSRFDIGVMPLPDEEWARGKCALKALQYMAMGVPTVTSPVGVNADIIRDGENGLLASTEEEWVAKLVALVQDARLREHLGRAGRITVEKEYAASIQAPRVLELLRRVGCPCGRPAPGQKQVANNDVPEHPQPSV
jgi:glycosyltransferase involved in cell wall biosynthesis